MAASAVAALVRVDLLTMHQHSQNENTAYDHDGEEVPHCHPELRSDILPHPPQLENLFH